MVYPPNKAVTSKSNAVKAIQNNLFTQLVTNNNHLDSMEMKEVEPTIPNDLLHHHLESQEAITMSWSVITGPVRSDDDNMYYDVYPFSSVGYASDIMNHWWSNLPKDIHSESTLIINVKSSDPYTKHSDVDDGYSTDKIDQDMTKYIEYDQKSAITYVSMYQRSKPSPQFQESPHRNLSANFLKESVNELSPLRVYRVTNP